MAPLNTVKPPPALLAAELALPTLPSSSLAACAAPDIFDLLSFSSLERDWISLASFRASELACLPLTT